MKTLILSFILILGLAAPNYSKPINDIFSIKEPVFTEEAYVNDIPFDTWEIAVRAFLEGDEFKLEDEPYVDDIPFNTRTIFNKYLLRKMLETSDEANVNDIPFNTEKLLNEHLLAHLTEQYRNEQTIQDLPALPKNIICSYEKGVVSCVVVKKIKQEIVEF